MQTLLCPHCKKEIAIDKALEEQVLSQTLEIEKAKLKEELQKASELEKQKLAKKIKEEMDLQLTNAQKENSENKERIEKLMQDVLKANEEMRHLRQKEDELKLENEKKLQEEREKMKEEIGKVESEKSQLKLAELQKQLDDTKKALEESLRKSQQSSQQLQGEVLELQLEQTLKESFPQDTIEPVQKGVRGADIKQTVKTQLGNVCGIILWELKRTKSWSDEWITKLKEDLRSQKANIPIIVSETLPQEAKSGFGHRDGVLICSFSLCIPIAEIFRRQLIAIAKERYVLEHRNNKTDIERLFEYITSHEFVQQVEALIELRHEMHTQLDAEKAAFERVWKKREMLINKMSGSTASIIGTIQGVLGNSMPQIKGLELAELDSGEV